jgi:arsenite-transporting ATPase
LTSKRAKRDGSTSRADARAREASRTSASGRNATRPSTTAGLTSSSGQLPLTRYLFFGGKGGVGKTTAAAAAALRLLDRAKEGERILIFSTDPAHSLSDSFEIEINDRFVEVARGKTVRNPPVLFAREMDAARALDEFKTANRTILAEIADRGTMLDEADINELLDLSLPGMDEVMALFELSEIVRKDLYARVVVDTAPTGHTARMLRLPDVFSRWIGALDRMSEKHRYMVAQFVRGRKAREDEVDVFLRDLSDRVRAVRAMLFDGDHSSFTLVTVPEAMAVEETTRYLEFLRAKSVPVTDLVINRVESEHGACPYCSARATTQSRWLEQLENECNGLKIHRAPQFPQEVRGRDALRQFASATWTDGQVGEASAANHVKRKLSKSSRKTHSDFRLPLRQLLVFGGKGGVGKTSAAAATALALAESKRNAHVLVFSIDPAHSLSDSFEEKIGEMKRGVAGLSNLDAMEIDPTRRFEELKERYQKWTDELFTSLTGGSRWEIQFDREAMRELVSLAPPGIDEIAALATISDLIEQNGYTTIVLDTAPTGHLLRFLELPDIALSWVRTFLKLLLKYKNVVRWGGVAEELVALSKSIKRVAALLVNAESTEFVGVAIPERMSLSETSRMAKSLARLKVPMRKLLLNNLVVEAAAESCEFCSARRRGQTPVIAEFRRMFGRKLEVYTAPQHPFEVSGPERLREHFSSWRLEA